LKVDQVLKRISLSVEELDFTPKSDERIESSSKPILTNPKVALKQIDLEQ
jgi:hypothetical protein